MPPTNINLLTDGDYFHLILKWLIEHAGSKVKRQGYSDLNDLRIMYVLPHPNGLWGIGIVYTNPQEGSLVYSLAAPSDIVYRGKAGVDTNGEITLYYETLSKIYEEHLADASNVEGDPSTNCVGWVFPAELSREDTALAMLEKVSTGSRHELEYAKNTVFDYTHFR